MDELVRAATGRLQGHRPARGAAALRLLAAALLLSLFPATAGAQIDIGVIVQSPARGSTTSPVVVVEHVELTFPNGTGSQTVERDQRGFYAQARFKYQGNGPLTLFWVVDGAVVTQTVETLTYGTSLTARSDKFGFSLPTFQPGPHTVTLRFDNGSGLPSGVVVPTIRYFVAQTAEPFGELTLVPRRPAAGQTVDPMVLDFEWSASAGFARYRVELARGTPSSTTPLSQTLLGTVQQPTVAGLPTPLPSTTATTQPVLQPAEVPVLVAETQDTAYIPPLAERLQLAAGAYRWRVTGFPAGAGQDAVATAWVEFRTTAPPPPGGVFFRSVHALPESFEAVTGLVQTQPEPSFSGDGGRAPASYERLTSSLRLVVTQDVSAGLTWYLAPRIENSTFFERGGVVLEVREAAELLSRTLLPVLQPGTFVWTPVPWPVPVLAGSGELTLTLLQNGGVLDAARLVWTAPVALEMGGLDFRAFTPPALPSPQLPGPPCSVTLIDPAWGGLRLGGGTTLSEGLARARVTSLTVKEVQTLDRVSSFTASEGDEGAFGGVVTDAGLLDAYRQTCGDWRGSFAGFLDTLARQARLLAASPACASASTVVPPLRAEPPVSFENLRLAGILDRLARGEVTCGQLAPLAGDFDKAARTLRVAPDPSASALVYPLRFQVYRVGEGGATALAWEDPEPVYLGRHDADRPVQSSLWRAPTAGPYRVALQAYEPAAPLSVTRDGGLPTHLAMAGFTLEVLAYDAGSSLAKGLSGSARARWRGDEAQQDLPLRFDGIQVASSGSALHALVTGGTARLDATQPLALRLQGYEVGLRSLALDALRATADLSVLFPAPRPATLETLARHTFSFEGVDVQNGGEFLVEGRFDSDWPDLRPMAHRGVLVPYGEDIALKLAGARLVADFSPHLGYAGQEGGPQWQGIGLSGGLVRVPFRSRADLPMTAGLDESLLGLFDTVDGAQLHGRFGYLALGPGGTVQGTEIEVVPASRAPGYFGEAPAEGDAVRPLHPAGFTLHIRGGTFDLEGTGVGGIDLSGMLELPPEYEAAPLAFGRLRRKLDGARNLGFETEELTGSLPAVTLDGFTLRPSRARLQIPGGSNFGQLVPAVGTETFLWPESLAAFDAWVEQARERYRNRPGLHLEGGTLDRGTPVDKVGAFDGRVHALRLRFESSALAEGWALGELAIPRPVNLRIGFSGELTSAAELLVPEDGLIAPPAEAGWPLEYWRATLRPGTGEAFAPAPAPSSPWASPVAFPLDGQREDGVLVLAGALADGGLHGEWLSLDNPDPAYFRGAQAIPGVLFDGDRIEVRNARLTLDVAPEFGGAEFYGAVGSPFDLVEVRDFTGAGSGRLGAPVASSGEFRVTLDLLPDGNLGYGGDPDGSPVVTAGSLGFLGIPFTPTGEISFARYRGEQAASTDQAPGASTAVAGHADDGLLGLEVGAPAPGAAPASPLVTLEGQIHFSVMGARDIRIHHTAAGARVPYLSPPLMSCTDLFRDNGLTLPFPLPEQEDLPRDVVCGDSRGIVQGRFPLRFVNTYGKGILNAALASAAEQHGAPGGAWDVQGYDAVAADEYKGFLGKAELRVLNTLSVTGLAEAGVLGDGTRFEKVSVGGGVNLFRALLAALNPARTGAKLFGAGFDLATGLEGAGERFFYLVMEASAFGFTLAEALATDTCEVAAQGGAAPTGGVSEAAAAACAPAWLELKRQLIGDGAQIVGNALGLAREVFAQVLPDASSGLPDGMESWVGFAARVAEDLALSVGDAVNFESLTPEDVALILLRAVDDALEGVLRTMPSPDPFGARILPAAVHLPVRVARPLLETGGLSERDLWGLVRDGVTLGDDVAWLDGVRDQQPLLPLATALARFAVEEAERARSGALGPEDVARLLELLGRLLDLACGAGDARPGEAERFLQAWEGITGLRGDDLKTALGLSRAALGWTRDGSLPVQGGSPDPQEVVRRVVLPLLDELTGEGAPPGVLCASKAGFDPYHAEVVSLLRVARQALAVVNVGPGDDLGALDWAVNTVAEAAQAANQIAAKHGGGAPLPPVVFTLLEGVKAAARAAAEGEPPPVQALQVASAFVPTAREVAVLSGAAYGPEAVDVVAALLAQAEAAASPGVGGTPPAADLLVAGAGRVAGRLASLPLNPEMRRALALLARVLEGVARQLDPSAGHDVAGMLRLAGEALALLGEASPDPAVRQASELAGWVLDRLMGVVLAGGVGSPAGTARLARDLLDGARRVAAAPEQAAGMLDALLALVEALPAPPGRNGLEAQAWLAAGLADSLLAGDLPALARTELALARRALDGLLHGLPETFELRDASGALVALRDILSDGTIREFNAAEGLLRLLSPSGRLEVHAVSSPDQQLGSDTLRFLETVLSDGRHFRWDQGEGLARWSFLEGTSGFPGFVVREAATLALGPGGAPLSAGRALAAQFTEGEWTLAFDGSYVTQRGPAGQFVKRLPPVGIEPVEPSGKVRATGEPVAIAVNLPDGRRLEYSAGSPYVVVKGSREHYVFEDPSQILGRMSEVRLEDGRLVFSMRDHSDGYQLVADGEKSLTYRLYPNGDFEFREGAISEAGQVEEGALIAAWADAGSTLAWGSRVSPTREQQFLRDVRGVYQSAAVEWHRQGGLTFEYRAFPGRDAFPGDRAFRVARADGTEYFWAYCEVSPTSLSSYRRVCWARLTDDWGSLEWRQTASGGYQLTADPPAPDGSRQVPSSGDAADDVADALGEGLGGEPEGTNTTVHPDGTTETKTPLWTKRRSPDGKVTLTLPTDAPDEGGGGGEEIIITYDEEAPPRTVPPRPPPTVCSDLPPGHEEHDFQEQLRRWLGDIRAQEAQARALDGERRRLKGEVLVLREEARRIGACVLGWEAAEYLAILNAIETAAERRRAERCYQMNAPDRMIRCIEEETGFVDPETGRRRQPGDPPKPDPCTKPLEQRTSDEALACRDTSCQLGDCDDEDTPDQDAWRRGAEARTYLAVRAAAKRAEGAAEKGAVAGSALWLGGRCQIDLRKCPPQAGSGAPSYEDTARGLIGEAAGDAADYLTSNPWMLRTDPSAWERRIRESGPAGARTAYDTFRAAADDLRGRGCASDETLSWALLVAERIGQVKRVDVPSAPTSVLTAPAPEDWDLLEAEVLGFASDCLVADMDAATEGLRDSGVRLDRSERAAAAAAGKRAERFYNRFPPAARPPLDQAYQRLRQAYEARTAGVVAAARDGLPSAAGDYQRIALLHAEMEALAPTRILPSPVAAVAAAFRPYEERAGSAAEPAVGMLSEGELRELGHLVRFVQEVGRDAAGFYDEDALRRLILAAFHEATAGPGTGESDGTVPPALEELVRLLGLLGSAGLAPDDLGATEAGYRLWALESLLRARELDFLTPPPTLDHLVALFRVLQAMRSSIPPALLATSEPFLRYAAQFDDAARQVVADGGQYGLLAAHGTPRDLRHVLELLAELAPAAAGSRTVLPAGTAVAGDVVQAYGGLVREMLGASNLLHFRDAPGPSTPGAALTSAESALRAASEAVRRAPVQRGFEVLATRLGAEPTFEDVEDLVVLAALAERVGFADIAAAARADAATAASALRETLAAAPAADAAGAGTAQELALFDRMVLGLDADPAWASALGQALGGPLPGAVDFRASLEEVLRHVEAALGPLGPGAARGRAEVLRAVVAVPGTRFFGASQAEAAKALVRIGGEVVVSEWAAGESPLLAAVVRGAVGLAVAPPPRLPDELAAFGADLADAFGETLGKGGLAPELQVLARTALPPLLRAVLAQGRPDPSGGPTSGIAYWKDQILRPLADGLAAQAQAEAWALGLAGESLLLTLDLSDGGLTPQGGALRALPLGARFLARPEVSALLASPPELAAAAGLLRGLLEEIVPRLESGDALWAALARVAGERLLAAGSLERDLYGWALDLGQESLGSGAGEVAGPAPGAALLEAAVSGAGVFSLTCVINRHLLPGIQIPPAVALLPFVAAGELARDPALLSQGEAGRARAGIHVAAGVVNVLTSGASLGRCPAPAGVSLAPGGDTPFGGFVRGLANLGDASGEVDVLATFLIEGVRVAEAASGGDTSLSEALAVLWNGPATVDYGGGPVAAGPVGLRDLLAGDADYLEVALTAPAAMGGLYRAISSKLRRADPMLRRLVDLLEGRCPRGTRAAEGQLLVLAPDVCQDRVANVLLALLEELRIALVYLGEGGRAGWDRSRGVHVRRAGETGPTGWEWGWFQTLPLREAGSHLEPAPDKIQVSADPALQKIREMVGAVDLARWVIGKLGALPGVEDYVNRGERVLAESPIGAESIGGRGFSGVAGGYLGLVRPDNSAAHALLAVGNLEFPVLGAAAAQVMYNVETASTGAYPASTEYLRIRAGAGVPETEFLGQYFGDGGNPVPLLAALSSLNYSLDAKLSRTENAFSLRTEGNLGPLDLGTFALTGRVDLAEASPTYLDGELCGGRQSGLVSLGGRPLPLQPKVGAEGRLWKRGADLGLGLQRQAGLGVNIAEIDTAMEVGFAGGLFGGSQALGTCGRFYLQGRFIGHTFTQEMRADVALYTGTGGPGVKLRYVLPVVRAGRLHIDKTFWLYLTPDALYVPTVARALDLTAGFPDPGDWVFHVPIVNGQLAGLPQRVQAGAWGGWGQSANLGDPCDLDLTCGLTP